MAAIDLHSLDISEPLNKLFTTGSTVEGAILSLVPETPMINVGENAPLVMNGRAKGALVHEGGAKPDNGRQITAKPFTTVKLVYSQRVTDEFMQWAEAKQADFVSNLIGDWVTRSLPRDIDTVVIHGVDPNTGNVDSNLSDYITKSGSSQIVPSTGTTAAALDADFASAVATLEDYNVNGIALAPSAAATLSTVMNGNVQKYTGLGVFGLAGGRGSVAGLNAAATAEVGEYGGVQLILGDFSNLMLGFAGTADWKTILYGDPDGTGVDLQNVNQVCVRMETKFGFRVLDPDAFAVVMTSEES